MFKILLIVALFLINAEIAEGGYFESMYRRRKGQAEIERRRAAERDVAVEEDEVLVGRENLLKQ